MTIKKQTLILIIIVILCALMLTFCLTDSIQDSISSQLIRLHIPANSDSERDQKIKLAVRDAVCTLLDEKLVDTQNIDDAERIISDSITEIERITDSVLQDNNAGYSADVMLCREYFDTRVYDTFTLPAGRYNALKITLGSGNGHNWWCVAFPPICSAITHGEDISELYFTGEELSVIENDGENIEFRFKLFEITSRIKEFFNNILEE